MLIDGGAITNNGTARTVTITGTPAFSQQFISFTDLGLVYLPGMTFSGSATGTRFSGSMNAVCQTGGGGANYFSGSGAGSYGSGAQYSLTFNRNLWSAIYQPLDLTCGLV
jgi:hypothetical protein